MRALLALLVLALGAAPAPAALGTPPALPDVGDLPAPAPVVPAVPTFAPRVPLEQPLAPPAPSLAPAPPPPALPPIAVIAAGSAALALVLVGLYSRLARGDVLEHRRRDAVHRLLADSPGLPLTEVARRTGMAWGTAVYHLGRLEQAGLVTSLRCAGRRCWFPVGTLPRDARPGLGALQQGTSREVAEFVASKPGATQTELCAGLGLSASAASKQLTKLESAGLVRREREHKAVRVHPEPGLLSLFAHDGAMRPKLPAVMMAGTRARGST